MQLNEYQDRAMTTCMNTCSNWSYMFLNLVGEVGEFASKVAKHIRKGEAGISPWRENDLGFFERDDVADAHKTELRKEAGDILWQLSGLCSVMGWTLEEVAQENLEKLASRKDRGVIDGNGDNR